MSEDYPDVGGNRLSRRDFLKLAGGVGAGAGLLGIIDRLRRSGKQLKSAPQQPAVLASETPEATGEVSQETSMREYEGVKVWFDGEGVPIRWEDGGGGTGEFDGEKLEAARERALSETNYHVAEVVRVKTAFSEEENEEVQINLSEEITELPEDVLGEEELVKRGVKIIDSERVGFYVRRSAFEQGGLMEQYGVGGERGLKIVIVDAVSVNNEAFVDRRYDEVRGVVNTHFKPVDYVRRTTYPPAVEDPLERELNKQALAVVTDEEFSAWGLRGASGHALWKGHEAGDADSDLVFLAISPPKARPERLSVLEVRVTFNGEFEVSVKDVAIADLATGNRPLEIGPGQSYTPPGEYVDLPRYEEGSFNWKVLAGVDPGTKDPYFVAVHELQHAKSYAVLGGLDEEPKGVEQMRYYSEQETDDAAKGILARAYEHYDETGDNRLYPIVLENKADGYFVIG